MVFSRTATFARGSRELSAECFVDWALFVKTLCRQEENTPPYCCNNIDSEEQRVFFGLLHVIMSKDPMDHIHTPKVEGVKLLDRLNPRNSPIGTLYLPTSHLIFIEAQAKKEVWILHMLMSQKDKPLLTTSGRWGILCDFNHIMILFQSMYLAKL